MSSRRSGHAHVPHRIAGLVSTISVSSLLRFQHSYLPSTRIALQLSSHGDGRTSLQHLVHELEQSERPDVVLIDPSERNCSDNLTPLQRPSSSRLTILRAPKTATPVASSPGVALLGPTSPGPAVFPPVGLGLVDMERPFSPTSPAAAPLPRAPTKIYSHEQVMAEIGLTSAALSAGDLGLSPTLQQLELEDITPAQQDFASDDTLGLNPLPDDITLPFGDRPAELAELLAISSNRAIFELICETLSHGCERAGIDGDPGRWDVEAFRQHLALPREQCPDEFWVDALLRCVRRRSELLWERLRAIIGAEATEADNTPELESGDLTTTPASYAEPSPRPTGLSIEEVTDNSPLIGSERCVLELDKMAAQHRADLLSDGPHEFTGGPIFFAASPRRGRASLDRSGSWGSSLGRRPSLGMSPIREAEDQQGNMADEEDDHSPGLARSVSFASIGSGRSTDRFVPRQPFSAVSEGLTSPRSVHGIRFSTSASPRHIRQSTGASSEFQLRGDEFQGFSDNDVRAVAFRH